MICVHSDLPTLFSGWSCLRQQKRLATHHSSDVCLTHPPELLKSSILGSANNNNSVLLITGRHRPHFPPFRAQDYFGKIAVLLRFHCFVTRTDWFHLVFLYPRTTACLLVAGIPAEPVKQQEASGFRRRVCSFPPLNSPVCGLLWSGSLLHCVQLKVFDWNNHRICRRTRNHAQIRLGVFLRLWRSSPGNHPTITVAAASAVFTRAGETHTEGGC